MPPKKSVPTHSGAPSKSGRQRTLTNKQQQLRKTYYYVFLLHLIPFFLPNSCPEKREGGCCKTMSTHRCDSVRAAHGRNTVAQKTAPMFACFSMIGLVWNADIIQGSKIFVHKTTLYKLPKTVYIM